MQNIYPWLDPVLASLLARRRALPHALLIHGVPGIGKSALATAFANALLCEQPTPTGAACGTCPACGWFAQSNHPDLRLLAPGVEEDAAGKEKASRDIRIGQIRALAGFLGVGAHRGGRKVVVIDPADAMNVPAANALLKTLEEPLGDTVFLLVSSRADALPATIRSRCVAVAVPMPTADVALAWLVEDLRLADAPTSAETVRGWLAAVGGAPLRARAFAEPAEAAAHRLVLKSVASIPENTAIQTADAIASLPARAWLPMLQAWIGDLGRVAAGAQPRRFPAQTARLRQLASATTLARVGGFDAWLGRQLPATEHPLNARLFCEDVLMRYTALFNEGA